MLTIEVTEDEKHDLEFALNVVSSFLSKINEPVNFSLNNKKNIEKIYREKIFRKVERILSGKIGQYFHEWMDDSIGGECFAAGGTSQYYEDLGNSFGFISIGYLYSSFFEYCEKKNYLKNDHDADRVITFNKYKNLLSISDFGALLDAEGVEALEGRIFDKETIERLKRAYPKPRWE